MIGIDLKLVCLLPGFDGCPNIPVDAPVAPAAFPAWFPKIPPPVGGLPLVVLVLFWGG
jgi:hypothetical protein